jgi:hypothetical protein
VQEPGQKIIDSEMAAQMLPLVLPEGRFVPQFCTFLTEQKDYKKVTAWGRGVLVCRITRHKRWGRCQLSMGQRLELGGVVSGLGAVVGLLCRCMVLCAAHASTPPCTNAPTGCSCRRRSMPTSGPSECACWPSWGGLVC